MPTGYCARALVRLALVLLLAAAGAAVWELLARQAPGSLFFLGSLPGPIEQLRLTVTFLALGMLAAAWLLPWAYGPREPRAMLAICYAGAALTVGISFYGALKGMYLVQIVDLRPEAVALLALKSLGQLMLAACLLDLSWRILFRKPAP